MSIRRQESVLRFGSAYVKDADHGPAPHHMNGGSEEQDVIRAIHGVEEEDPGFAHHKTMVFSLVVAIMATFVLTIVNVILNSTIPYKPNSPGLPGVMPSLGDPKVLLGVVPGWAPYTTLVRNASTGEMQLSGALVEMAKGMESVCKVQVEMVQATWGDCVVNDGPGTALAMGVYHACLGYTHAFGQRSRQLEFSEAALRKDSRPAGLLVRLDSSKDPIDRNNAALTGKEQNLNGTKIAYVDKPHGMFPTEDGFHMSKNTCTNRTRYWTGEETAVDKQWYTMHAYSSEDAALSAVMAQTVDAAWIFADTAGDRNGCPAGSTDPYNCDLWRAGLGERFAYIHTGVTDIAYNGTTLAVAKKGAGIAPLINMCLERFQLTKTYWEVCTKYNMLDECYPNAFFDAPDGSAAANATKDLTSECSSGYCKCPE